MSKRPTDHMEPSAKRRPETQGRRDDPSDDEVEDPGNWQESNKAPEEVLKSRKILKARRHGGPPVPTEPSKTPDASNGAEVGGDAQPAEALKAANPFAGISLLSKPAPAAAQPTDPPPSTQDSLEAAVPAKAELGTKDAVAPETDTQDEAATSPAKPAGLAAAALATAEIANGADDSAAVASKTNDAAAAPAASIAGGSFGGFSFGSNLAKSTGSGFGALAGSAGSSGGGFGAAAAAAKGEGGSEGGLFGGKPAFAFRASTAEKDADAPVQSVFGGPNAGIASSTATANSAVALLKPDAGDSEVVTGEEEERSVFSGDGTLFGFEAAGWKERGRGELRVKVDQKGQARIIMRQRGNLRLLLNANLWEDMAVNVMDGALGVTFAVHNAAVQQETEGKTDDTEKEAADAAAAAPKRELSTFAFRVKTQQALEDFKSAVEQHKKAHAVAANV